MTRKKIFASLCSALLLVICYTAADAAFPEKPINYLIPFNSGGESDIFARAQQPLLEKALGQRVEISYKEGGGGAVGWNELVRSAPTGYYTAGFNLPHIILQPLQRKSAGYNTADIKPVMIFMSTPNILAVPKDSPYANLQDFVAAAKTKPGAIVLGGSGSGSANHLGVVLFNRLAGIKTSYIPFTGTGDAMPALLGKHVAGLMTFTTMGIQHKNEIRVLAVATEQRVPGIDAPTFKELGYNLVEGAYRGIAVPPQTPDDIVKTLYEAFNKVNADPEFIKQMEALGFTIEHMNPADSAKFISERVESYKAILEELAVKK